MLSISSSNGKRLISRSKSKNPLKIEDLNNSKFSERKKSLEDTGRKSLDKKISKTKKAATFSLCSAEKLSREKKKTSKGSRDNSFNLETSIQSLESSFPVPKWENEKIFRYYDHIKKAESNSYELLHQPTLKNEANFDKNLEKVSFIANEEKKIAEKIMKKSEDYENEKKICYS